MISKFAMDEIDAMKEAGLDPSPRDIVRLNALGLKIQAARGKAVRDTSFLLPRVSAVGPGKFFREPSIGHEVWLDAVLRFVAADDEMTILALNCFALSRPSSALPDPTNLDEIQQTVKAFCEDYREYPARTLAAAIEYVKFGCDHIDYERGPERGETAADGIERTGETDVASRVDESDNIGILRDGIAILTGVPLSDLKEMTSSEIANAVRRACILKGVRYGTDEESAALGAFYGALEEIKKRLTKAKENENGPAS